MAIAECARGHVYDTEQYSACPYCNNGQSIINFGGGKPEGANGRTVAPGMQYRGDVDLGDRMRDMADPGFMPGGSEPGKTVAPDACRNRAEEANKTVGWFKKEHEYEPVVGWLVCIEGPEKGKDYHLLARINTIGRDDENDVCIRKDNTISRKRHASLAYDPRHNSFRLIPGDSRDNIYLNDDPVDGSVKLSPYDLIEFGDSKMVFIPLCSDRFNWTEGLKHQ